MRYETKITVEKWIARKNITQTLHVVDTTTRMGKELLHPKVI